MQDIKWIIDNLKWILPVWIIIKDWNSVENTFTNIIKYFLCIAPYKFRVRCIENYCDLYIKRLTIDHKILIFKEIKFRDYLLNKHNVTIQPKNYETDSIEDYTVKFYRKSLNKPYI